MTTVTHVAGPAVVIAGRVVQRCPVCGEKLADNRGVMMPVNRDGSAPEFPVWKEMDLVQMEGNRTSVVGDFLQDKLPDDFCLALVE